MFGILLAFHVDYDIKLIILKVDIIKLVFIDKTIILIKCIFN